MSQAAPYQRDEKLGAQLPPEAPEGQVSDPSYKTGKDEPVPVVGDEEPVAEPMKPGQADTDKQLEQDEREAIDKGNIMKERTRHAKPGQSYAEPSDEQMGLME
ncbi:bce728d1-ffa4-4b48-b5b8-b96eab7526a2 [Thermothielavioides terrestris]|uniref:Histone chaperone domain-containing protein n=2 Tax=Thermothielavioides terrestris TaxID=2587410 RepID=G2R9C8_THETT|nr:uncharacterized protein THITE_2118262 [Thermothielavioides terrestris NRRL 8126]AEO68669.1 hypothetical protein THITE_2118262 [Thermothielavioides terrestris NRRL 8126]SPQ23055.1 bce728d1-ffa4-4b48-b5b8-b96eab7526a2 [Thermothielavioides terrestris]